MASAIQPHNERAAATWGAGGADYDAISRTIADSIEHCVHRLGPRPGERVLDLATGTGWAARLAAARGAKVVGVDIGADLIEAAKERARQADLEIEFEVGDAERLRFEDESFDVVVSTCGVMFASSPEAAAAEIARVSKRGGRVGLTTWPPEGTLAQMFQVMRPYMPSPPSPPPPSPFEWGRRERVRELLGSAFDLKFETGTTVLREPDGEAVWRLFSTGYGPTKTIAGKLDPERREQLRHDFVAFHDQFRGDLGVAMPREYLLTIGIRR
ncbi:MAG TPA: class I SAM-dependent methyltransferase [Geminicoccaceae bacterium]|jgi:SAM-dependent methyltransferase|nr:class I SAM-dependent methyltransferase [Geminicoccaceae bacterium]